MRSFLCIFAAITGLIFLKRPGPENGGGPVAPTPPGASGTITPTSPSIPSLTERHAQRDAHLRDRLAAAQAHGANCACAAHRK